MTPKTFLLILVGALVVLIVYLGFRPAGGGIENVDAAGAKAAIDGGAQIIDVRTPGEYQMGHIKGAINVPVEQVSAQAAGWDKNLTYVVYCATGARSTTAVNELKALGFNNIKHLSAGVQSWSDPLEKGSASSGLKIETAGKPVMIEFFTDA